MACPCGRRLARALEASAASPRVVVGAARARGAHTAAASRRPDPAACRRTRRVAAPAAGGPPARRSSSSSSSHGADAGAGAGGAAQSGAASPPPQPQPAPPQPADEHEPAANLDALLACAADGLGTPAFDTYALRHLVHCPPAHTAHLSSLTVAPARVLRRYAVTAASGERCVMTLAFEHDPAPTGLPRTAALQAQQAQQAQPQPQPERGWVLASARGEPAWPDAPLGAAPEHPPEAVVAAQLAALRDMDAFTAWRFLAPSARPGFGGTAERFAAALEAPPLAPLLLHGGSEPVLRRQQGAGRYHEVLRVEAISGEWAEFCWSLVLEKDGPLANCWAVESITPVGAPGGCPSAGDCGGPCAVAEDWGLEA